MKTHVTELVVGALAALLAAALGSLVFVTQVGAATRAEQTLASYTLTAVDGNRLKLSSLKGEIVVVNFWASWCAPCRKELPVMDRWNDKWSGKGARVIAVSIDEERRKAVRFAEETDLSLAVFHDGPNGLARSLDLPSLPCTYLLDRDGSIVTVIRSSSPKDLAALEKKVDSMIASSRGAVVQRSGMDGGTQSTEEEAP